MSNHTIGLTEIYSFPLPPQGFDPLEASAEDLTRNGFPRRPDAAALPHVFTRHQLLT